MSLKDAIGKLLESVGPVPDASRPRRRLTGRGYRARRKAKVAKGVRTEQGPPRLGRASGPGSLDYEHEIRAMAQNRGRVYIEEALKMCAKHKQIAPRSPLRRMEMEQVIWNLALNAPE